MSSGAFSGIGGGGGDKKGEEQSGEGHLSSSSSLSSASSHAHILPQQPVMDMKTLQSIRPKLSQTLAAGGPPLGQPAVSAILPPGIVSAPSEIPHGHITTTPSTGARGNLPVSLTQQNIVHLSGATAPTMPIIRSNIQPRPQFTSHLPRGAIATASALSKTGPNIATPAAAAIVRPPVPIPVSSSAIHSGQMPTLSTPIGRTTLLSAIKQGTPPPRSPSPALSIGTPQPAVDPHRAFPIHASPATTSQNIQITLTTPRSTTAIEIPKPINTGSQQKPLSIPAPMAMQTSSKVIVSQAVSPLLQHQALAKSVNLTMAGHTSSSSAAPVTLGSINTPTTVASTLSTIPIAKVTPQRQQQSLSQPISLAQSQVQDLSRSEAVASTTAVTAPHPIGQPPTGIFIPQPHRPVTTTATPLSTAISATVPATTPQDSRIDSRPAGNIPQLSHFLPQQEALWPSQYHQFMYQQVAAQSPRQGISTLIFPRAQIDQSVPSQNPNLAATLQAHAMTVAPGQTVRFANQMVVQQMSAGLHTQYAASPSTISTCASLPLQDSKPVISTQANICRTPPPADVHGHGLTSGATVASSIYTSSPNMQTQQSSTNNPSASPRPSILRKRTSEGVGVVVKRPLGLMPDSHSPRPEPQQPQSNTSSPKTPAGDNNSQSSTDTALSSNDATTPTQNSHGDLKIKQEPSDGLENGPSLLNSMASSPLNNSVEASPRKKPRKQLLNATEELKDNTSTDEEVEKVPFKENKTKEIKKEHREDYVDEEGVRWTTEKKRPNVNLLNFYNITWKPKSNHFLRFADVKPKEERRPTVNELSNQRGIHQRASGWKLYHMASQLENLTDLEKDMCGRISQLQTALSPRPHAQSKQASVEDYNGILHELSQANIQRCQLITDQLEEARSSMLKILEHKPRIQEIINKHMSKRPIKKKERT